jgi:multicomponent Na+:H+ antiporter subunit C
MDVVVYLACTTLIGIGLYCIVTKKNLIKIVIGFGIMEYAVNMFFCLLGYRRDAVAPVITELGGSKSFVDPIPQALVLTAIVIGLGVTAVMVSLCIRIYEKYGTFDITEIRRLKG